MHHTLHSFLVLVALLGSCLAAPKNRDIAYSKVHRQSILSGPKNGVTAMNKVFSKYHMTKPDELASAVANEKISIGANPSTTNEKVANGYGHESANVVATPVNDNTEYVCPVTVGGQTLNLMIDTGSTDLWVFNTAMPAEDQTSRSTFNSYASKSYDFISGATFSVGYGDQSETYGSVGKDTVELAGLTVTSQYIGMPTVVSDSFTSDTWSDGILGLGFKSNSYIAPNKEPSFFENLLGSLQAPLFTANLKQDTAGNYQFGYIDNTAYSGELHYTPVNNSQGYWQFETSPEHSPAIADTGSSVLLLDTDLVDNYWKYVPTHTSNSAGAVIFPCSEKLPDFHIQLGVSYTATIAGEMLNYAGLNDPKWPGYCYGGIQYNNGQGINVFGDIMFQSQFVVFDYGNMRLGFAPHA